MQLINQGNVYTFVLTESEWYAATEQQREAWQVQIKREGEAAQCRYLALMVEPDAIMSISPIARRHVVWRHVFPTNIEEDFCASLLAIKDLHHKNLTPVRMAALAASVFKP